MRTANKEARVPREPGQAQGEHAYPCKKTWVGIKPPCCEAAVLATAPPCCLGFRQVMTRKPQYNSLDVKDHQSLASLTLNKSPAMLNNDFPPNNQQSFSHE